MKTRGLRATVRAGFLFVLLAAPSFTWSATFNVTNVTEFQSALDTAASNGEDDTINVAVGTYNVATTLSYNSAENHSLTIVGAGAATTILDGGDTTQLLNLSTTSANGDVTVRRMTIRNGSDNDFGGGLAAEVDAATITVEDCTFHRNAAAGTPTVSGVGGGASAISNSGSVIVRNSTFTDNTATNDGGGLSTYTVNGTILITGSTFDNNSTATAGGDDAGGAAAVAEGTGVITISGNTFSNNSSGDDGGGAFAYLDLPGGTINVSSNTFTDNQAGLGGGGSFTRSNAAGTITVENNTYSGNSTLMGQGGGAFLFILSGSASFTNNTYISNTTSIAGVEPDGGGFWAWTGDASLTLSGSTFTNNHAGRNGGGADLSTDSGTITLTNNTLDSNDADNVGGGISMATDSGTLSIMNNTLYNNSANEGGGVSFYTDRAGTTLSIYNTILWGDTPDAIVQTGTGPVSATYSDIQSGSGQSWFGAGCIDQDPLFAAPVSGDFHIQAGSPCIDAGDGDHAPDFDFEGDPRWDDPAVPNTGVGTPPYVDMGVDERYGGSGPGYNDDPPSSTVKLIFIHHSTGEDWLRDEHGGLGIALRDNNYFVSDTNYGWGPDNIGDTTDIGHWWTWFRGPNRDTYVAALYKEYGQHSTYSRLGKDPGGENQIIMFKSCFPNSNLSGNPNDPPTTGDNPLRGEDASSEHMTVANAKGIYNDILEYFATRTDKLFIVITAPPLMAGDTAPAQAANARGLNNWLVREWLASYPHNNVAVFDFFNVLTSNGGDPNTNDAGWEDGNHHRFWNGELQHIQTVDYDMAAYPSGDSHPTAAGDQKATVEFTHLLNIYYHLWRDVTPDFEVNPDEGTIGTEFTITGAGFGTRKPKVKMAGVGIKDKKLKRIKPWMDTLIRCLVKKPMPAGTYDLTIKPKIRGADTIVLADAFTMRAPQITSVVPAAGSKGDEIVINGNFFGTKKGKVHLVDLNGDTRKCKVVRGGWTMTAIRFRVPRGIAGLCDVMVTNKVGSDTLEGAFTVN